VCVWSLLTKCSEVCVYPLPARKFDKKDFEETKNRSCCMWNEDTSFMSSATGIGIDSVALLFYLSDICKCFGHVLHACQTESIQMYIDAAT
jgi:hypothetical protein